MKGIINEIIALCNKPETACAYVEDIATSDYFRFDFDTTGLKTIYTDDIFHDEHQLDTSWIIRFIPEDMLDAFTTNVEMLSQAEDIRSRSGDYVPVMKLADKYLKTYYRLIDTYSKDEYNNIPCYMFLHEGSEDSVPRVFTVKPSVVLRFIGTKINAHV